MANFDISMENLAKVAAGRGFTIHALGAVGSFELRTEIDQRTYCSGWSLTDAMQDIMTKAPCAEVYRVIVHEPNGGLVSGTERDAMPGY